MQGRAVMQQAAMKQQMEQAVLAGLQQAEQHLDGQIESLDTMQRDIAQGDKETLQRLRRKRLQELEERKKEETQWRKNGHGELHTLQEKAFFECAKQSKRIVVHFGRPSNPFCGTLNEHLGLIARHHMETKFIYLDAEKSPFLTQRLQIRVLPSLVLVKDNRTDKTLTGIGDITGHTQDAKGRFTTKSVEHALYEAGLLESCAVTENDVDAEEDNGFQHDDRRTFEGMRGRIRGVRTATIDPDDIDWDDIDTGSDSDFSSD
ncbi:MAG: hypothetical protein MHM6MM_006338 [Cercozoa sp. M6MM]